MPRNSQGPGDRWVDADDRVVDLDRRGDVAVLEQRVTAPARQRELLLWCRYRLRRHDRGADRAGRGAAADRNELGCCQLPDRVATDRELLLLPLHLLTIQQGAGRDHGLGDSRQRDTSPPTPRVTMSSPS